MNLPVAETDDLSVVTEQPVDFEYPPSYAHDYIEPSGTDAVPKVRPIPPKPELQYCANQREYEEQLRSWKEYCDTHYKNDYWRDMANLQIYNSKPQFQVEIEPQIRNQRPTMPTFSSELTSILNRMACELQLSAQDRTRFVNKLQDDLTFANITTVPQYIAHVHDLAQTLKQANRRPIHSSVLQRLSWNCPHVQ